MAILYDIWPWIGRVSDFWRWWVCSNKSHYNKKYFVVCSAITTCIMWHYVTKNWTLSSLPESYSTLSPLLICHPPSSPGEQCKKYLMFNVCLINYPDYLNFYYRGWKGHVNWNWTSGLVLNTNVQSFVLHKCQGVYLNLYMVKLLLRALNHGYFLNSERMFFSL